MHSILPLTWTTALCIFWTLPPSSHSALSGVDVVLRKEHYSPSSSENFSENSEKFKYVDNGKPATLKCFAKLQGDWNVEELDWYKNDESLTTKCASQGNVYNDTNRETKEVSLTRRCDVFPLSDETIEGQGRGKSISLRFNKIFRDDFGVYKCKGRFTQGSQEDRELVVKEIHLRETVSAKRTNWLKKNQRSVLVYENEALYIYCNLTGTERRDDLSITWSKDDKNITEEYLEGYGDFACSTNDSKEIDRRDKGNNFCKRIAHMKHRGWYTCQVNNIKTGQVEAKHTYYIRVKVASSLLYPGVILAIEIVVLTIITIVTWKNTTGENKLDGNDWEDDDENEHDENYVADEELEDLTSKPLTSD